MEVKIGWGVMRWAGMGSGWGGDGLGWGGVGKRGGKERRHLQRFAIFPAPEEGVDAIACANLRRGVKLVRTCVCCAARCVLCGRACALLVVVAAVALAAVRTCEWVNSK